MNLAKRAKICDFDDTWSLVVDSPDVIIVTEIDNFDVPSFHSYVLIINSSLNGVILTNFGWFTPHVDLSNRL